MFPITFTFFSVTFGISYTHIYQIVALYCLAHVVNSFSFQFCGVFLSLFELKRENLKPANRLNRRRGSSVSFVLALTILLVLCGFFRLC